MRLTILGLLTGLLVSAAFLSCGSKGGGSSTPETSLAVTTNPKNGDDLAAAPGPQFTLTVTVTSVMPPKGVTIAVTATVDGTTTTFFTNSVSTSAATSTFTITGTPSQKVCDVNITVTSNTLSSNTYKASYRYTMK